MIDARIEAMLLKGLGLLARILVCTLDAWELLELMRIFSFEIGRR